MRDALLNSVMTAVALTAIPTAGIAQEFTVEEKDATSKKAAYSPFVDQHYPTPQLSFPFEHEVDRHPAERWQAQVPPGGNGTARERLDRDLEILE